MNTRWKALVPFIAIRLIKASRCVLDTEWNSVVRSVIKPLRAYVCEDNMDSFGK